MKDKRDSNVRRFLTEAMVALFRTGSPRSVEKARSYQAQIQKLEANKGKASKIVARRRRRDRIAKASRRRNRAA